ncbi:DUF2946 family protein [Corticimicrobacter populi]|uniref:DUF2946 domain-containing protein n=1 Tax=Corticimicrobacter populi TaxID=2175229 RepID=A0A2V1K8U5_9BURK|nr:DUF2946 family protein [Corticimicrobacter populi]PWF25402.1 DUF2946 domain-containing protein [Corticimicrobacter populi]
MPARRYAPRYAHGFMRLLVCMGLLLWLARAMLPTGYMPDGDALRQGNLSLIFCSAEGHGDPAARTAWYEQEGQALPGLLDTGDESPATDMATCPFALMAGAVPPPSTQALPGPMIRLTRAPLPVLMLPAATPAPAGPPLGSRAPPAHIFTT